MEVGTSDKAEATPAAPAVAAPSSAPTASAAMERAAAAASSPAPVPAVKIGDDPSLVPDPAKVGATAAATVQPPATGQPEAGAKGPIPFDRHESALKNARESARAEVEKSFEWAKGLDGGAVREAVSLIQELRKDPKAFYARLGSELGAQGTADTSDELPEADLIDQTGKIKAYSADAVQKAIAVSVQRMQKQLLGELQPLLDEHRTNLTAKEERQRDEQGVKDAGEAIRNLEQYPHFVENKAAIGKIYGEIPADMRAKLGAIQCLYMAYNEFLKSNVFPGIESAAEKRVRDGFSRKAATSVGAHPTDQGGQPTTKTPTNQRELAAHMERMAAASA